PAVQAVPRALRRERGEESGAREPRGTPRARSAGERARRRHDPRGGPDPRRASGQGLHHVSDPRVKSERDSGAKAKARLGIEWSYVRRPQQVRRHTQVRLLRTDEPAFPAMLEAIRAARLQ